MELGEFVLLCIKATIHHVLYLRQLYPRTLFRSEKIFGTCVQSCRHPDVKRYISDVIESLQVSSA